MNTAKLRRSRWQRSMESFFLVLGLSANLAGLGWLLGGAFFSFCVAFSILVVYLVSPSVAPEFIVRFYRGRRIAWHQAPRVYTLVHQLAQNAGIETSPTLYYLPSTVPNALAVGSRQRAGIALSDGLLRKLDMKQLAAVLAHEISHITNNDVRRNTLAAISVRLTHSLGIVGKFLLLLNLPLLLIGAWQVSWMLVGALILSPTIANALVMALSRVHEYQADLQAVELTCDPQSLASALLELDTSSRENWSDWFQPKWRYLIQGGWFSTHPATQERIRRLEEIWDSNTYPMSPPVTEAYLFSPRLNGTHGFPFCNVPEQCGP